MIEQANQSRRLLRILSDLRWAFKDLAKQVVSDLGDDRAQLGEAIGPTWQFMGDDESVGYTDGQFIQLASGAAVLAEVSFFWRGGEIEVFGAVGAELDGEGDRAEILGLPRIVSRDLDAVIEVLEECRSLVSMVGAERIVDFVSREGW